MSKKSIPPKDWREGRRNARLANCMNTDGNRKTSPAALGVTEGSRKAKWLKKSQRARNGSLATSPLPPGATPKTESRGSERNCRRCWQKGAEAFGFRGEVWTTKRVAQMIQQHFGGQLPPGLIVVASFAVSSRVYKKPIQKGDATR